MHFTNGPHHSLDTCRYRSIVDNGQRPSVGNRTSNEGRGPVDTEL